MTSWQDKSLDIEVGLHATEKAMQDDPRPPVESWVAACESQGLPTNIGMDLFVKHHRGNAGAAAFFEAMALGWLSGGHHSGFCRGCAYNHEALQGYGLDADQTYAITTAAHEEGMAAAAAKHEPINVGFDRTPVSNPIHEAMFGSLNDEITLLRTVVGAMASYGVSTASGFAVGSPERAAFLRAMAEPRNVSESGSESLIDALETVDRVMHEDDNL